MLTNTPNSAHWYLLQCKPRQDERAQLNLQQQDYITYRPLHVSERLIRGKRHRVLESLFPGYLFVQLSCSDHWAPIRSTRGVSRIVEFNHVPAEVADEVIEHLRLRSIQSLDKLHDCKAIEPGEMLQIVHGPLAPLEGVFMSMLGAERVMLLLQFLNRQQQVCVPLSDLERQRS